MIWRRLKNPDKKVALTFDDGPDPTATPALLDLLKRHSIPAAFFMIGQKAQAHPDLVREVDRQGHLIGNHSFTHRPALAVSKVVLQREIVHTQEAIAEILGKRPNFYRPPRGILAPWLRSTVKQCGLELVYWSRMPGDYWFWHSRSWIQRKLSKQMKGGDIWILHDGLNLKTGQYRNNTLEALEGALPRLKKKFSFVRLDEGLELTAYQN